MLIVLCLLSLVLLVVEDDVYPGQSWFGSGDLVFVTGGQRTSGDAKIQEAG